MLLTYMYMMNLITIKTLYFKNTASIFIEWISLTLFKTFVEKTWRTNVLTILIIITKITLLIAY